MSSGNLHCVAMARLKTLVAVFTVTTRIIPSCPGLTSIIRARGHFSGGVVSSRRMTRSSILMFGLSIVHFSRL